MNPTAIVSVKTSVAKRLLAILLALTMLFICTPIPTFADVGTGYGSNGRFLAPIGPIEEGSIPISNRVELSKIGNDPDFPLNGVYHLTADIDFSGGLWRWDSIGDYNNPFTGIFDGQGYVISNLKMVGNYRYSGLFGYAHNAEIKNVGLEGTDINAYIQLVSDAIRVYAGGICGISDLSSISNCYNVGDIQAISVSSDSYAGGICGINRGSVVNSYNIGEVYASTEGEYTVGAVSYAGGICGLNGGSVANSYNTGDIRASVGLYAYDTAGAMAGGISGNNTGYINDCYSIGDISASIPFVTTSSESIPYAGGIIGNNSGDINACYSTGDVSIKSDYDTYYSVGGICGSNKPSGALTNCYWNIDNNQTSNENPVTLKKGVGVSLDGNDPTTSRTTTQMKDRGNCQTNYAGFDFYNVWGFHDDININDGYPVLRVIYQEPEPTYSAAINPTSKTFPTVGSGYDNVAMAQEFTIQNTGTAKITNLVASILSASYDYANFEIITELSATTLAPGETATLSVRPANDLEPYSYADILTITGDNGINLMVPLSFTVSDEPVCEVMVDPTSKTFTAAQAGYNNTDMAQIFTIENTGTEDVTGLSASLGSVNFEISSPLSATTLTSGSALTISVRPVNGLAANQTPYTDILTITGDNEIHVIVPLYFTVSAAPTYTMTIDPASKTYSTAQAGYNNGMMAQVFTIQNTGTGQITGLSATAVNSGGTATIGVRPINGLEASSVPYTGTLTIMGSNGINLIVPLSFTVSAEPAGVVYGDLNSDGAVDSADLLLMLRYFAQPGVVINTTAADVNGDGIVDSADLILRQSSKCNALGEKSSIILEYILCLRYTNL